MGRVGGIALVMGLWLASVGGAHAEDVDGTKLLLCVPTDIVSCNDAGDCDRMTAEEAAVPQFMDVDLKAGTVKGKLASGEERTAKLGEVTNLESAFVAQGLGADGNRAFSVRIGHDGELSVGIADAGGGLLIFGACTPR